jgi:hypothetical protein
VSLKLHQTTDIKPESQEFEREIRVEWERMKDGLQVIENVQARFVAVMTEYTQKLVKPLCAQLWTAF